MINQDYFDNIYDGINDFSKIKRGLMDVLKIIEYYGKSSDLDIIEACSSICFDVINNFLYSIKSYSLWINSNESSKFSYIYINVLLDNLYYVLHGENNNFDKKDFVFYIPEKMHDVQLLGSSEEGGDFWIYIFLVIHKLLYIYGKDFIKRTWIDKGDEIIFNIMIKKNNLLLENDYIKNIYSVYRKVIYLSCDMLLSMVGGYFIVLDTGDHIELYMYIEKVLYGSSSPSKKEDTKLINRLQNSMELLTLNTYKSIQEILLVLDIYIREKNLNKNIYPLFEKIVKSDDELKSISKDFKDWAIQYKFINIDEVNDNM